MLTTVMVGAGSSRRIDLGRGSAVYTPRGYARHLDSNDTDGKAAS